MNLRWLFVFCLGVAPLAAAAAPLILAKPVPQGAMPVRVHVFEDYETEIEKRWWLRGAAVITNLPPSLSGSLSNTRACRATPTKDFDDKMGDPAARYNAVIFNPVPGPPMGPRTRLSFRYWLKGAETMRVQIYSLSKNYHRQLVLAALPQGQWQSATVDMTQARRPDGSGGPLAEDERIDDIQFYVAPDAELFIDDIVLYEAAAEKEEEFFPRRVIWTGWFDTGKQGVEWPGHFDIVLHQKPRTWDAAQSVPHAEGGLPWIRLHLRGARALSAQSALFFRYHLSAEAKITIKLVNTKTGREHAVRIPNAVAGEWDDVTISFPVPLLPARQPERVDEIHLLLDRKAELRIDDVLLFEPGK